MTEKIKEIAFPSGRATDQAAPVMGLSSHSGRLAGYSPVTDSESVLNEELDEIAESEIVSGVDLPDGLESSPTSIDWAKTLDENQTWLRTVIAARVGEAEGVEEVFQEVSLAAVRQKAPIHDPAKVAPWLYRLAVIHSLLYRRKIGRKKKLIDRFTQKIPISEHDQRQKEPLEWLLAQERKKMVADAMSRLPKPVQEVLLLKYIHDWSYKEMAEKLGMTVSAIQAKLHRARGMLKKELSQTLSPEDIA